MSANATTAAPTGRKKFGQGKEQSGSNVAAASRRGLEGAKQRRDASATSVTLGHDSPNTSSPEGAKEGNLPPGWRWTTIGQLKALSLYGPRFSSDDYRDSGVFVLRTTDISESGKVVTSRAPQLHLTEDDLKRYQLKRGDLLITRTGSLGTLAVFNDDVKAIAGAYLIQYRLAGPPITSWYVFYALKSPVGQNHLVGSGAGVGRPNLNAPTIDAFAFRLPPEEDQRRIVAEIEKQFTRLDAGVAALRRVRASLKRYRAAVLKAACEGRLVPTEAELRKTADRADGTDTKTRKSASSAQSAVKTPAFETGEALLARILTERRQNWQGRGKYKEPAAPDTANLPPLPEGWTWATVEQLAALVQFGSSAKTHEDASGVPVLRMGNIQEGKLDLDKLKYLPKSHDEFPELLLAKGDLLFNRTNSAELVGKTAVFRGTPEPCSFASYLIRVRLCDGCLPDMVAYFINSVFGRAWIAGCVSQQVGQANVNGTKLQALAIPLPPLAEQTRIVEEVERRLSVVEELEAVVSANLQRATRLRQSILQKAFTGTLI